MKMEIETERKEGNRKEAKFMEAIRCGLYICAWIIMLYLAFIGLRALSTESTSSSEQTAMEMQTEVSQYYT